MSCITQGEMKLSGAVKMDCITSFQMKQEANKHAYAIVSGTISHHGTDLMGRVDYRKVVVVTAKENIIFCGYIRKIQYETVGKTIAKVSLELNASSILLDKKRRKRSFQDVSKKLADIMGDVVRSDEKGDILYLASEKKIRMPVIQYAETDWEFIRRLTSRVGSIVVPEITSHQPRLYIGFPEGGEIIKQPNQRYIMGFDEGYFLPERRHALENRFDFIYYEITSYQEYSFGSKVKFLENVWNIIEKRAELIQEELIFTYRLGRQKSLLLARYENKLFAGMSILGKVVSVRGETVRLHLDIDETQDIGTAFGYSWSPETGNAMYCMPNVGTTVTLYFKNEQEESATATSCIRENASMCKAFSDCKNRYLTTDNGKQLYLKPMEIGVCSEKAGMALGLEDEVGIRIESGNSLLIQAGQSIHLKGETITVTTPTELKIMKQ